MSIIKYDLKKRRIGGKMLYTLNDKPQPMHFTFNNVLV